MHKQMLSGCRCPKFARKAAESDRVTGESLSVTPDT